MQQHSSKYFAGRPPHPQRMRSIDQNSTFSEHGHAAYQNIIFSEHRHVAYRVKANHKCSNMVAYILPADSLAKLGPKGQNLTFFIIMSCCISYLKG